jgi:hypothetical protein
MTNKHIMQKQKVNVEQGLPWSNIMMSSLSLTDSVTKQNDW